MSRADWARPAEWRRAVAEYRYGRTGTPAELPRFILDIIDEVVFKPGQPRPHEPIGGCNEPGCPEPHACAVTCSVCKCHPPYCSCV
jgi:hypothetical protein